MKEVCFPFQSSLFLFFEALQVLSFHSCMMDGDVVYEYSTNNGTT